jgi:hypothetical protein
VTKLKTNKTAMFGIVAILSMLFLAYVVVARNDADQVAADLPEVNPTMDTVERQLESGAHEKLLVRISEREAIMNEFTTDGCSGGLSAGWENLSAQVPGIADQHGDRPPWENCCVVHDVAYHQGGATSASASDSFDERKRADLELLSCVAATSAARSDELQQQYGLNEQQVTILYQSIAELMYRAVRLGGVPCSGQPWRWGYGWPQC